MFMKDVNEGITYDIKSDSFIFDFKNNSENSIIEFNDLSLTPVNIGVNEVYYFGYQFNNNDDATSQIRTKFFNALRYDIIHLPKEAKQQFILNALSKLHKQINIWSFNTIVCPESRSTLNAQIIKTLCSLIKYRELPTLTLVKNAPKHISFDWNSWNSYIDTEKKNGHNIFVNQAAKNNAIKSIEKLLDKIHKSEYFSIAETVKKNKYKIFIKDYLVPEQKDTETIINAKNIFIIDDVATTGATLFECIKSIRCLNQTAKIIIFTLVGKKDIG